MLRRASINSDGYHRKRGHGGAGFNSLGIYFRNADLFLLIEQYNFLIQPMILSSHNIYKCKLKANHFIIHDYSCSHS